MVFGSRWLVRSRPTGAALISALVLCVAATPPAPAEDKGIVTVQVENDLVANTDRDYTNGLKLSYLSAERKAEDLSHRIAGRIPLLGLYPKRRYGVAFGHSIFTPNDTDRGELILDDRPYAAWLHVSLSLLTYKDGPASDGGAADDVDFLQSLVLDVGVIGPAALGEDAQNGWHDVIAVDDAQGWDNQLENEPGLMLTYEYTQRHPFWRTDSKKLGADTMVHLGAAAGNVMTYAAVGGTMRLGWGLGRDFGPPRIRPSLPGGGQFAPNGFSGYAFAGVDGRLVARNIFLDGNTFTDSHSIDKRKVVADVQAGLALAWRDFRASYTQVYRTSEAEGLAPHRFGALSVSYRIEF